MLISNFSKVTGLSRDTVRFYVRLGLLNPVKTDKGGRNPYQFFTEDDIQTAEVIRISQSLGMSLKEVAELLQERRERKLSKDRRIEIMQRQLARLEAREAEIKRMTGFLRAKIDWLSGGSRGARPELLLSGLAVSDCED